MIVDADAHVVECDRTWDYLETPEKQYRPVQLASPEQDGVSLQFWLVDGKVRGLRLPAFSEEELERLQRQVGRRFAEPRESGELGNVGLRLEYMDANKVDVQVLHNTMFIEKVTERPPVEVALCGSWNRWLADIWSQSDGRLRWSCLAPTLSMSDALDQIRFSKEHGACAVLMRPVEGNRLLVDPYFYPIYEEASRLDMAIAVHIGNGSAWLNDLYRHPVRLGATFHRFRIPTVGGFADVLFSEVPELFPKLRWGFVEASAQWLPWILHEVRNRFQDHGPGMAGQPHGPLPDVRDLREHRRPAVHRAGDRRGRLGHRHGLRPHGHVQRCGRHQGFPEADRPVRARQAQDPQRQRVPALRAVGVGLKPARARTAAWLGKARKGARP